MNSSHIHTEILETLCRNQGKTIDKYFRDDDSVIRILQEYLPGYFSKMLERYPADRIILLDVRSADWWYSKDGMIRDSRKSESDSWNRRFDFSFRMAKQYLPGCHVIEFPKGVCADENHRWGLTRIHYSDDFYLYADKAVRVITKCLKPEEESSSLQWLKEEAEQIIAEKNKRVLKKTADKAVEAKRLWKYSDFAKELLVSGVGFDKAVSYMKTRGITSCALYGMGQAGIWFYQYLRKQGFTVDYVIEDGYKTDDGGKSVGRQADPYPPTPFIVICDLFNIDGIKKKLSGRGISSYADIYEMTIGSAQK